MPSPAVIALAATGSATVREVAVRIASTDRRQRGGEDHEVGDESQEALAVPGPEVARDVDRGRRAAASTDAPALYQSKRNSAISSSKPPTAAISSPRPELARVPCALLECCLRPTGPTPACPLRACSVFRSSIAIVIGPTPPGTGVIARARSAADSKSTSPTRPSSVRFMPTSITVAPGFTMSPVIRRGRPTAATSTSAAPADLGEVARARVADRHGRVLGEQQRGRPACRPGRCARRRPPRLPRAACPHARSSSITPEGVAGTSAVAALQRAARVGRREPVHVLARVDRADHARRRRCGSGSGSCTMMPLTARSAFSSATSSSSSSCGVLGRQVVADRADADLVAGLCLPPT